MVVAVPPVTTATYLPSPDASTVTVVAVGFAMAWLQRTRPVESCTTQTWLADRPWPVACTRTARSLSTLHAGRSTPDCSRTVPSWTTARACPPTAAISRVAGSPDGGGNGSA